MNNANLEKIDNLTLSINFDLAILSSAIKDSENLEICELEDFVKRIYQESNKIRDFFDNEINYN